MQLQKFFKGFYYAFRGIEFGLSERNMRFHVVAMVVVLGLGAWLRISQVEWTVVWLAIGLVIGLELINTAIEDLANQLRDELHLPFALTTRARDVAAGAVLVGAIVAAIIGGLIFGPKVWALI